MNATTRRLAVGVAAVIGLAGCGSAGTDDVAGHAAAAATSAPATSAPEPSPSPSPSPSATAEASPEASPSPTDPPATEPPATHDVVTEGEHGPIGDGGYDGPMPADGHGASGDEALAVTFAELWFTFSHDQPERQRRASWAHMLTERARRQLEGTDEQYESVDGLRRVQGRSARAKMDTVNPQKQDVRESSYVVTLTTEETYDPDGDGRIDSTQHYSKWVRLDLVDPDGTGDWRIDRISRD